MKLITALIASISLMAPAIAEASMKDSVKAVAPALEKYKDTVVRDKVWKRDGLNARDRSIVTLTALISRNQTAELAEYLNLALASGLKPAEISEIITHLGFYAGWGNALAAVNVAETVFKARKVSIKELASVSPKLLPLNEEAEATRAKRVGEMIGTVFPGMADYTTDVLFKDLWLRPDLAPRDRSLVTISSLVASGQVAQLGGHINIGMGNGLKQEEIAEALTHLAFYVGWPNIFSAMPVAKETFEKRAAPQGR